MPPCSFAKFEELADYVGWTAADQRLLASHAPVLLACREALIDDFYEQIGRHPEAAAVIRGGPAQVARLKATLSEWLVQLITAPLDAEYVRRRSEVGRRHVEIGLEQRYAGAALARLRSGLLRGLEANWGGDTAGLLDVLDALEKRIDLDALIIQEAYEEANLARHDRLAQQNQRLRAVIQRHDPGGKMVGESAPMQEVYRLIGRAGPTDKPILVQGETGSGKELVARALHRASRRRDEPLVAINCAALPEPLLESELFGHEKGAFTGAVNAKPGLFEVADGGTLFIDEIGELAGGLQAKLLRVLEDGVFRRVGAVAETRVSVRLIAATNRDLAGEVAARRFREDLFYRINVICIPLPPLRARGGDLSLLLQHFAGDGWAWEPDLLPTLEAYSWPGNVRQLQNALERAKVLAEDEVLRVANLPPEIVRASHASPPAEAAADDLDSVSRRHIAETLVRCNGNKSRAARALGVSRRAMYRLLEKYGIADPQ
ncbi:MAG: sigma 54-interacting transcriptional regulator [Planctomycetota bacterium]